MHFATGKALSRRTFLQGMGAAVALPYLDAMEPAFRGYSRAGRAAAAAKKTRFVCMETVHGVAGSNTWGASKHLWAPAGVGRDFTLNPDGALAPLEAWKKYLTVVSNTDVRMAEAFEGPEIGGDHFRSSAVFLTQSHPKQTQGSDVFVGTSIDQIVARRFGKETPLPSMQLCIEDLDRGGGCEYNYACAYTDTVSWAGPTEPLPMIRDPRVAFDLLFGAGANHADRATRRQANKSILDWIVGEVSGLKRELGAGDRQRLDKYLTDVRELERRIQAVEAKNSSGDARELPEAPIGVPDSFAEHMKLMFDVQVLAFQSDMTRVTTFKTSRDASTRQFPESGTDKTFHPASHHGGREAAILDYNKINRYHVSMIPYFLEKLKESQDDGGNLLDQTAIIYGSPMADGNIHNHRRCPLIMLGHGNGILEGGLHVKAPDGTPMANAFLSLLHGFGATDMASFGDSTGELALSAPSGSAPAAAQQR
ncbi:DUF1552 domain-containing protein [Roseisolibacter sp. H3M3-2]|uniref:DUF1552 domain-containing protein n=1 Tax=Roseisolibacter sp. H3M3-2 TaxID=3031323 RepID=UPI0023D98871|nr:DUF1552 domain-containing protein [Roseisolibacter sp. H3M3-2]MDF1504033.1 DUF1552 domain-containing protein [Roseisolibacter sp. H3M3-2]